MRARDIIEVCLLAARRQVGSSACSLRWRGQTLAIVLTCCALTDLTSFVRGQTPRALAESRALPRWSWPDDPPDGADCLARSDLARRIEEQLGGPLSEADFAFSFDAHIERTADGFRLVLTSEHDGQHGERTFEGSTCREVSEAAVLLITLSLDDARTSRGSRAREAPADATQNGAPTAAPAEGARAAAQAHDRPREHWGVGAGALLDVGTLPRAAAGFELGVSLAWARSRFALTGVGLPAVRSEPGQDGARVEVSLWAARLGYCHTLLGTRVSLGACLGVELGKASGLGVDLLSPQPTSLVWAAGWLAARVAAALHEHWALALEPALAIPVKRGEFVSSDADGAATAVLYTQAKVSGRVSLALELSF